jgi:transposase
MAGTFDGLSDLEWKLFADLLPPEPTQRGRGMPHTAFRNVVHAVLSVLITGGRWCDLPRGPPMGVQECRPSGAAALAGRWHPRDDASPSAWAGRGTRDDSVALRWRGGLLFPLAKAAVRGAPLAAQAKVSSSIAARMGQAGHCPRARRRPMGTSGRTSCRGWRPCTSAPANEADHGNASRCWRWRRGMTPKSSVVASAAAVSGPRFPNGCGSAANRGGGRSTRTCLAIKSSGRLPGFSGSTAAWSCAGHVSPHAATRFLPEP